GVLHLIPEDYGMIFDSGCAMRSDRLWQLGWIDAGLRTGIDLRIGRKLPSMLMRRGLQNVQAHYAVVDSLRVDRTTLRSMFDGWRRFADDWVVANTSMPASELHALFDQFLATIEAPDGYVVWQVPIVSAQKG